MTGPKPLRGRQAEAIRNDEIVLRAAREVFAEQGFDAPVAAIAERAGVGMGSLYRRYGGKQELLQRVCVLSLEQNLEAAERALAAEDPWPALCRYVRDCVGFAAGAFGPAAGLIHATDEMWRLARAVRRRVGRLVQRAHDDGSLRADATAVDVLQLVEHFARGFPSGPDVAVDAVRRRQLEIALAGLRTGAGPRLPGPTPKASDYEARWS